MTAKRKQKNAAARIGDRLLTLRETSKVLRLNPRTVRECVNRGEIEGRIIGGPWRFRRADLDAFFENALTRISSERIITGIRRWSGQNRSADGTPTALDHSGRGSRLFATAVSPLRPKLAVSVEVCSNMSYNGCAGVTLPASSATLMARTRMRSLSGSVNVLAP